jgi:hypothetical protein
MPINADNGHSYDALPIQDYTQQIPEITDSRTHYFLLYKYLQCNFGQTILL